ncbi:hypothetical protein [Brevibacillus marinus]|uniref:hypothetical protein n=1 Tax=Brevibacillus marinus TaxID=2496837 RepID=UPI001F4944BA|nr:hypothetical protein [Brevibacillus marinus]
MAKTYYAEGRQIANLLRGLFGLLAIVLYFYLIPGLHWSFFFIFLFAGVIAAEIIGTMWTKSRRKKSAKNTKASAQPSTRQKVHRTAKQSASTKTKRKLTDEEIIHADIDTLSGTDFERLIELYYKDHGYDVSGSAAQAITKSI